MINSAKPYSFIKKKKPQMLPKMSYSTLLIRETTMKISLEDAQNAKEQVDHPAILYYSGEQTHSKGSKVAHYRDTCLPMLHSTVNASLVSEPASVPIAEEWTKKSSISSRSLFIIFTH